MRRVKPAGKERGASIVELALIAPIMVMLVFGVLDLGRAYRTQIRLENAAREGAAVAQLVPNKVRDCPSSDIQERALAEDPDIGFIVTVFGIDDDGNEAIMSGCTGDVAQAGERVKVEVSAEFEILTPLVANVVGDSITLTGDAEVRVQGQVRS
jgi:hypothetical protein